MALINIESSLKTVLETLDRLHPPEGMEILSYKRNRGITLLKTDNDNVRIREQGYMDTELVTPIGKVAKILKVMFRREFPRSRKVRVSRLGGREDCKRRKKVL